MFLRQTELMLLEEIYRKDEADFVIIYGRRRLGKTTLVLKFLQGKKGAYLYTPHAEMEEILSNYIDSLRRQLGIRIYGKVTSFREFLDIIYDLSKMEKIIFVFDEFQRLHEADKSAISILQDYWDRKLRNTKIKIILVGSLIGMIERLAISGDAPLYGRQTARIKVAPLPYYRARQFWRKLNPEERIMAYGIFGGTPAYMDAYDFRKTLWENVYSLIISKNGKLSNEPEELLASELRTPSTYMSILERISMSERGLPLGKIKVRNVNVIPYLNKLEKMDIIERMYPLNEPKRGALYVFKDEFFRFWFRYIQRNYWLIEMERYDAVMEIIKKDINKYLSFTLEKILRETLTLFMGKKLLNTYIPIMKKFGAYWEKELEVDALGISEDTIIVGEAKWQEKPIGIKEISSIIEKAETLAKKFKKRKYIVLILSKKGFKKEYNEENLILMDLLTLEEQLDKISQTHTRS